MAKDKKLAFTTYQVSYNATVDIDKKVSDSDIESYNKKCPEYPWRSSMIITRHSEFNKETDICFAAISNFARRVRSAFKCNLNLNIDIKVFKGTTDMPSPNRTFFDIDFIQSYLSYLKTFFNYNFNVIENKDDFIIHVEYDACSGNIMCLLSFIRYMYEWPFQAALMIVDKYVKENEKYKDYFMYILHKVILRLSDGVGHTPYTRYDPQMYTDADLRSLISKDSYTYGYEIFSLSGIDSGIVPAKFTSRKLDICKSLEDVLDGTAYIQIEPLIHKFFILK